MHCPTCHRALIAETSFGQIIDRCRSCNGLWLDATELGAILRQSTAPVRTDPERRRCKHGIKCPRCKRLLTPFNYAHDSGVYINRCARCDGVWLERGQLDLLVQYRIGTPATHALADAWSQELRGRNRKLFIRQVLRSRVLSGTVAAALLLDVIFATGDPYVAASLFVFLLFPLLCIWFADAMGNRQGMPFGPARPGITRTTPGDFVALGGWFLLFARVVVSFMMRP